ncbi:Uncharacterised protein [Escherichia coli]|nr:Uncharacterised protein [Escherichia coli]
MDAWEAFYILESDDGVPFSLRQKLKKATASGNGATRGGKTFMKNCIASHLLNSVVCITVWISILAQSQWLISLGMMGLHLPLIAISVWF